MDEKEDLERDEVMEDSGGREEWEDTDSMEEVEATKGRKKIQLRWNQLPPPLRKKN